MQHAGFTFRIVKGQVLTGGPGVYIYMHQATGKCFVRAMRNARVQRSRNNYPTLLKALLKTNPSEVMLFLAELPKDTKDALYQSERAVAASLSEKGVLYKHPGRSRGGLYRMLPGEENTLFTVWRMKHKETGAVFYFDDAVGAAREKIEAKVSQRLLSFNNYVIKQVVNANRVIYNFLKHRGLTDISHWELTDLEQAFDSEKSAQKHITKLSRDHMVNGDAVVLNRVADVDGLYYRNTMLKLDHQSMEQYLGLAA